MNIDNLTEDERLVSAAAINRYGDGQHPAADQDNLEHFEAAYAAKCLAKATPNLRAPYDATAFLAILKLEAGRP